MTETGEGGRGGMWVEERRGEGFKSKDGECCAPLFGGDKILWG